MAPEIEAYSTLGVKAIDQVNIDDAAEVLSRSFFLDPMFQFFFPDESTRQRLAYYTFRFIISHACRKGVVLETSPTLEGVAVWLPSLKLNRNMIDQLRFGAMRMYLKQGRSIINRQINASNHMKSLHRKLLAIPHLYLSTIGIDVAHRGKGFASRLILPMLEKADREGLSCYLDTHNECNIPLYQRFGFCVARESVLPGSSVRHWAMIRVNQ